MADEARLGVTGAHGRYHGLANLSVHDGSLFPTSIGANPQLSIYGITARLASGLAQQLTGRPAARPTRAETRYHAVMIKRLLILLLVLQAVFMGLLATGLYYWWRPAWRAR
jgi:hypothetical protein